MNRSDTESLTFLRAQEMLTVSSERSENTALKGATLDAMNLLRVYNQVQSNRKTEGFTTSRKVSPERVTSLLSWEDYVTPANMLTPEYIVPTSRHPACLFHPRLF